MILHVFKVSLFFYKGVTLIKTFFFLLNRAMSDFEETDFFWESWTSPAKRKRKKDSKKDRKNDINMKTDENKKKKKNSKFKEAMVRRNAKKKDKKKKKKKLPLELDDTLIFTQACSAQAHPTVKPETSNPRSSDRGKPDHLTQDCKTKRKKKVAFDLSPGYIRAKRPKFVCSSPQCPKESIFEDEAVGDSESCSQITVTGHSQQPTKDNNSQCTSEDINSQDLFITQKTFRAPSPEPSSGEASDKAIPATPQVFAQQGMLHTSVAQIKKHLDGSYSCPRDPHVPQRLRKKSERAKKPKTVLLTEDEEDGVGKTHNDHKNGKISLQTQMELNANLSEEKNALSPVHIKPSVNPFLAEPIAVTCSLDVAKKHPYTSSQQSMTSTSTQTENFFTTELSSYLNFCQKRRVSALLEDLKPLDLSLPQRARRDLGTCLSVKMASLPGPIKGDDHREPNLHPSCPSDMKDVEVKKEATGHKSETTLSPQSESEPRSADTTASSEDNEPPTRTGKLDLTQVIQEETVPTVHCTYTQIYLVLYLCGLHKKLQYSHLFHYFVLEFNHTFLVKCSLLKGNIPTFSASSNGNALFYFSQTPFMNSCSGQ